jgi:hypothetical protein
MEPRLKGTHLKQLLAHRTFEKTDRHFMSKKQIALVISGAAVVAGAAYVCFRARLKRRCELQSSLSPLTPAGIAAAASGNAPVPSESPSSVARISSHAPAPVASPPPNVNFATEWLDEHGCVCPKAVDYATQCPKGHALAPFADGGVSSHRLMCRICHAFTEREHALQWLVCSVTECCGGYAVCGGCAVALQQAPAAVVDRDDLFSLVCAVHKMHANCVALTAHGAVCRALLSLT